MPQLLSMKWSEPDAAPAPALAPRPASASVSRDRGHLWAVVLAGGPGARLRALTAALYGEPRPKPHAALTGSATLLRQTLDRVATLVPRERTVVVTMADHAQYLATEMPDLAGVHVLAQPCDRGTAAGVLLPAHFIHARDPDATMAVFPVDHVVPDEAAFMRHVAAIAGYAGAHADWLVLLGVKATEPDADYGWIEAGECIGSTEGGPLHRVRTFWEKPPADIAQHLFARGAMWNSFVFASSVAALIDTGSRCVPLLHERLLKMELFAGTTFEARALDRTYELAPRADFSRVVLQSPLPALAVAALPAPAWCDLGSPARVATARRQLGVPDFDA